MHFQTAMKRSISLSISEVVIESVPVSSLGGAVLVHLPAVCPADNWQFVPIICRHTYFEYVHGHLMELLDAPHEQDCLWCIAGNLA
jgi:hypothetical protein